MSPKLSILLFIVLLAAYIKAELATHGIVSALSTRERDPLPYRFVSPRRTAQPLVSDVDDLQVVDVVILASLDGKLHALNRTTGSMLWSMGDDPHSPLPAPTTFDSLVRTQHSSQEDSDQELFIIEPQSGDIYILPATASPSDPLQRLPFSMPQLVEMSPFSFPGDEHRVFVGRKETSMVVVELDTGRIKGTVKADQECFWDDDRTPMDGGYGDELDGSEPRRRKLQTSEIHIGRTDYHVRVHTRHNGVVQNLHFSSYGPNNVDREKQSQWRRTPDDLYVQPLSNGDILAFRIDAAQDAQHASSDEMPIWAQRFKQPIAAVFDVLTTPSRPNPFVLLQPRPHLEQLFPSRTTSRNRLMRNYPESTYVGLIGDSLFAMSHDSFPLIVFDQEAPRSAFMGIVEGENSEGDVCKGRQCLVGLRRSEPPSSQWNLPRLLDSVPHVPGRQERVSLDRGIESGQSSADVETNESRAAINVPARKRWKYNETKLGTWSAFGSALVVLVLLSRSIVSNARKQITSPPNPTVGDSPSSLTTSIPSSSAHLTTEKSPAVETVKNSLEADPSPSIPHISSPLIPSPVSNIPVEAEEGEESEKDGPPSDTPRKKGPRRRKRGKKKKLSEGQNIIDDEEETPVPQLDVPAVDVPVESGLPVTPTPASTAPPAPASTSLIVSDNVLGFGSHGTVVYEGTLQGRAVAVKRLLQDFVTIAAREVELLQESDDHPNVIRYFYQQSKDGFLYIALELCPASLADVIERPNVHASIVRVFDPKRAMAQMAAGLRHLHMLKIVHRDIKPQNILISQPKNGQYRMLISDFGLCKKLETDQTSFLPTTNALAAGTVGWRAPEILRDEVKLDEQPIDSDDRSSQGSGSSVRTSSSGTRLTRSVDIFALGCLFYYTLTSGSHPFGDRFEREVNILKGNVNLGDLEDFEGGTEASHLITLMLRQEAKARPDTTACLVHPFFWAPSKRLNFLQDASDRFEIMCREPREPPLVELETGAYDVVGHDWHSRLDRVFIENLGKFRKYDGRSVQDLLRALRNKKHHYQDIPDNVKRHLGPLPEGFLAYFTRRFPRLILHVQDVVMRCGLAEESMFRPYFELAEA